MEKEEGIIRERAKRDSVIQMEVTSGKQVQPSLFYLCTSGVIIPLTCKSDQRLISPYSITPES